MWRTPIGERTLRGCEWELFREGLGLLKDLVERWLDDPDSSTSGVDAFDRLQPASRLAMLAIVGKALHDEAEPCPELTAVTEGTFASVYVTIGDWIEVEIDTARDDPLPEDDEFGLRKLVLDTFREVTPEWEGSLPAPDCEDLGEWTFLLEVLMDRVLWDRDFEDEELFLDVDPERGHHMKKNSGNRRGLLHGDRSRTHRRRARGNLGEPEPALRATRTSPTAASLRKMMIIPGFDAAV